MREEKGIYMDQALSSFFYNTNTSNYFEEEDEDNIVKERIDNNECLTSVSTIESDDMSSSNDEEFVHDSPNSNQKKQGGKPRRDISAPFQPSPRATPRFTPMTERERPTDRIDYINTIFQPLEADEDMAYENVSNCYY